MFSLCPIRYIWCINPFFSGIITCRERNRISHNVLSLLEMFSCCHLQLSTDLIDHLCFLIWITNVTDTNVTDLIDMGLCKTRLKVKQKFMKIPCCNFPFILPSALLCWATSHRSHHPFSCQSTGFCVARLQSGKGEKKDKTLVTVMVSEKQTQTKGTIEKLGNSLLHLSEMCSTRFYPSCTRNLQHCRTMTNLCCAWSQFCCLHFCDDLQQTFEVTLPCLDT